MICKSCGANLSDDALFCEMCGSKQEPSEKQDLSENKEQQVISKPQEEQVVKEVKKPKKGKKVAKAILSVFLCVLIVLSGIGGSLIYQVRNATDEEAIKNLAGEIDFADLKIGSFIEGETKNQTLSEYIFSGMDNVLVRSFGITEKDVEKLLEEKFIKKFITGKLNDYVQDLFYATGDGIIEAEEIGELLNKNADTVYEYIGWYMGEREIGFMEKFMEKQGIADSTDLSRIRDNNPQPFMLVQNLLSWWMMSLLLVFAGLMAVCIFLVQDRKTRGFGYVGVSVLIVGIVNMAVGFTGTLLAKSMNDLISLGSKFWKQLFAPVQSDALMLGGIIAAVGVLFVVINIITKKIITKKASKASA